MVGFDFFDTRKLIESLSAHDKETMSLLFNGRNFSSDSTYKQFLQKLLESNFQDHEFELIEGDISKTVLEYVSNRPGAKISLLYLDLDLEIPTFDALTALWDRVSPGGIVVFDEYAYHNWSESVGVDKFFKDKYVEIQSLNYMAPSAYVIKS